MQIPRASSTKARGPGAEARRLWVLARRRRSAVSLPHPSHTYLLTYLLTYYLLLTSRKGHLEQFARFSPLPGSHVSFGLRSPRQMKTTSAFIFSVCLAVAHGFVVPHGPVRSTPVGCRPAAAAPLLPAQQLLSSRVAPRSTAAPVMGLFGLGAPELAIIGGVALMILGPDQLKKLAKDVGKVSAELKQVSTCSSPSQ